MDDGGEGGLSRVDFFEGGGALNGGLVGGEVQVAAIGDQLAGGWIVYKIFL